MSFEEVILKTYQVVLLKMTFLFKYTLKFLKHNYYLKENFIYY